MLPCSMLFLFILSLEGYSVQPLAPSSHASSLCVSVFSSRLSCCDGPADPRVTQSANVDAVDAASSISLVFATLTENTGGGVPPCVLALQTCHPAHPERSRRERTGRPRPRRKGADRVEGVLLPCDSLLTIHFRPSLFSYSYALFCNAQNAKSRIFSLLHTLSAKHRGVAPLRQSPLDTQCAFTRKRRSLVDFQTRRHVALTRMHIERVSARAELSLFLLLTKVSR
jgi:hypothetical protein